MIVVTKHRRRRRDDDALFLGLSSFDAWVVCAYDAIFSSVDENDRISTPVKEGGKKGAHIFFKTNGDENETKSVYHVYSAFSTVLVPKGGLCTENPSGLTFLCERGGTKKSAQRDALSSDALKIS